MRKTKFIVGWKYQTTIITTMIALESLQLHQQLQLKTIFASNIKFVFFMIFLSNHWFGFTFAFILSAFLFSGSLAVLSLFLTFAFIFYLYI